MLKQVSHLFQVASSGAEFVVLPDVFIAAREHQRSHSYQRIFGADRDPEHAVRIALLWAAFKRQVQDKSSTLMPQFDKRRLLLSSPANPAEKEDSVTDVTDICVTSEEVTKEESAESKMAEPACNQGSHTADPACNQGEWLFYPAKTRKVLLAGKRRNKSSASAVARARVQRSCKAAPEASFHRSDDSVTDSGHVLAYTV